MGLTANIVSPSSVPSQPLSATAAENLTPVNRVLTAVADASSPALLVDSEIGGLLTTRTYDGTTYAVWQVGFNGWTTVECGVGTLLGGVVAVVSDGVDAFVDVAEAKLAVSCATGATSANILEILRGAFVVIPSGAIYGHEASKQTFASLQ